MQIYKISNKNFKDIYKQLMCDKTGTTILSKKSKLHTIYIKDLHVGAANILKQDALSIGADLAVPSGVIIAKDEYVDGILIGTSKHLEILSRKELAQPFGLKKLAKKLKEFINQKEFKTKIMGIVNANDDSFFKNSRFKGSDAIAKIEQMIEDGADIIDLGGVSSRPGSAKVDPNEELNRLKPILDLIKKEKLYEKVDFSLDSYEPLPLKYALDCGFTIVNDITGLLNDEVCKLCKEYDTTAIIMHMQSDPQTMQNNPHYDNVVLEIDQFFEKRIQKAKEFGIEKIVLDVGIGFGKTKEHNLNLIQNLEHFKHFGYELLMGASRKTVISDVVESPIEQRLSGTLAIHLKSIENGASIIRCHDVKEHYQAIKVNEAINTAKIF